MSVTTLHYPRWMQVLCVLPSSDIYIAETKRKMELVDDQVNLIFKLFVNSQLIERDSSVQINKRVHTYHLTTKGIELQKCLVEAKKYL